MKKETGKKIIDKKIKKSGDMIDKSDNKIKKSGDNIKKSEDKIKKSHDKIKKSEDKIKKSHDKIKKTDNKIKKSNDKNTESKELKTFSIKNNSLVITNILFLVISVITFFILFFTTFIVKNNLPILGLNPNLISPFYEAFINDGKTIILNFTWFAYVAIALVLLVLIVGFLSFFATIKKKNLIDKKMFISSLINIPLTSIVLVFILIIGLIPVDTLAWEQNLLVQPGNIIIDIFDNISIIWIYYLNGSATLTTLGLVIMIIIATLASMIVILAITPFIFRFIISLNKNQSNEKISRIETSDTKESFRDFKKRIKVVNEEKEKKSKEDLISKNKKTTDDIDLKYLENDIKELDVKSTSGTIKDLDTENQSIRTSMIEIKTSMIDIENDDIDEAEIDGYLDQIIGKDK